MVDRQARYSGMRTQPRMRLTSSRLSTTGSLRSGMGRANWSVVKLLPSVFSKKNLMAHSAMVTVARA